MRACQRPTGRAHHQIGALLGFPFLLAAFGLLPFPKAEAAGPLVPIRVLIEHVAAIDDFEDGDEDFYAVVTIDGVETDLKGTAAATQFENDPDIRPDWKFLNLVQGATGSVSVQIEIYDEDGAFRLDDDLANIDPTVGNSFQDKTLQLTVNYDLVMETCEVTGDASGDCGTRITVEGGGDGDDEETLFEFRIEIPDQEAGRISCVHSPLVPDENDDVTVRAAYFDADSQPRAAQRYATYFLVSTVGDLPDPEAVGGENQVEFLTSIGTFPPDTQVFYGCQAAADGEAHWSGWKMLQTQGTPGVIHPALVTLDRQNTMDVVFIPDEVDYDDQNDPAFLEDVTRMIGILFSDPLLLENQQQINLWIANDTGRAAEYDSNADPACDHQGPSNWDTLFASYEVGVIVHRTFLRDCAPANSRLISADLEPGKLRVIIHELGHTPFGLADEYCCDGGYWQDSVLPNLYDDPGACQGDAPSGASCHQLEFDGDMVDFWTSDPASNDLMVDDKRTRHLDERRIRNWFEECLAGNISC